MVDYAQKYGYKIIGGGGGISEDPNYYYFIPPNFINMWKPTGAPTFSSNTTTTNNTMMMMMNNNGGTSPITANNSSCFDENNPNNSSTISGNMESKMYMMPDFGFKNIISNVNGCNVIYNSESCCCGGPPPQPPLSIPKAEIYYSNNNNNNSSTATIIAGGNSSSSGGGESYSTKDITWAVVVAIFHLFSLITLTCLVAILFSEHTSSHRDHHGSSFLSTMETDMRRPIPIVTKGWVITAGDCNFWFNGACVSQDEGLPDQSKVLGGIMEEREKKAFGLFSSINSPFLCLTAVIISTAFSICFIGHPDANARRMLRCLSIILIVVFATLFLFMQNSWSLPINNLLVVELELLIALIFLATENGHYSYIAQYVDMMLTNPLLIVSVLSIAGDDHTVRLILVFVCMILDPISLLINSLERKTTAESKSSSNNGISKAVQGICCICMIPLIIESIMLFKDIQKQSTWVIALLSFTFAAFMLRAIMGMTKLSLPDLFIFKYTVFLPVYDLAIKLGISMILVIGLFIELQL